MQKVMWWRKKIRTAPPQSSPSQPTEDRAGERHAEPERDRQAGDGPEHEGAVDEEDDRVGDQVGRVLSSSADSSLKRTQPTWA